MIIIIKKIDINTDEFIDIFDKVELNCKKRPLFTILNSIYPNSIYTYVLLNEIYNKYIDNNLKIYLNSVTNLCIETNICNSNNFENEINSLIKNNKYIILFGNVFYDKSSPYFNLNHRHKYFILKQFNQYTNQYTIIDEDYYAKSFHKNYIKNIEKNIYLTDIEEMCLNVDIIKHEFLDDEEIKSIKLKKYYIYMEIIKFDSTLCNIDECFKIFKLLVNNIVDNINLYQEIIINGFQSLIHSFDLVINDKEKMESFKLYKEEKYPKEIETLFIHRDNLSMIKKTFEFKMSESEEKRLILNLFNKVMNKYDIIKLMLRKAMISRKRDILEDVINNYLIDIHILEKELFENIFINIERIKKDFYI